MESSSTFWENSSNSPYMGYDVLYTENEIIPKVPLNSRMQQNVPAMKSGYSESGTTFNLSQDGSSENGISEQTQTHSSTFWENSTNSPYMGYDVLYTENEIIPKVPLNSRMQQNVPAMKSGYSESGTTFNLSQDGSSENGISEQTQTHSSTFWENSTNSPYMGYDVLYTENEIIPKVPLNSRMQQNVPAMNSGYSESGTTFNLSQDGSSENGISEQTQTHKLPSEPSHIVNGDLENKILVTNNTNEVFLKGNLNLTVKGDENGVSDLDSSAGVGKAASSEYCTDTSEKEDESIAHKVTNALCSGNSPAPSSSSAASEEVKAAKKRSRSTRRTYGLRSRSKRSSTQVPAAPPPEEDLLPFDIDQLLHRDYKPVTSKEIYLRKLIQQLDSTYTKAVVLVKRLEVDSALWRKYLSK